MQNFKQFDDRTSNMEAPVTTGTFIDANGQNWNSRPDNVINRYMSKVSLTKDEYWQYQKYVNDRKWFELDMFLDRLSQTADRDDLIRLGRAKEVISKMLQERNNE